MYSTLNDFPSRDRVLCDQISYSLFIYSDTLVNGRASVSPHIHHGLTMPRLSFSNSSAISRRSYLTSLGKSARQCNPFGYLKVTLTVIQLLELERQVMDTNKVEYLDKATTDPLVLVLVLVLIIVHDLTSHPTVTIGRFIYPSREAHWSSASRTVIRTASDHSSCPESQMTDLYQNKYRPYRIESSFGSQRQRSASEIPGLVLSVNDRMIDAL